MKQRIIVAVIGIPLLLAILCVAPDWATAALLCALCAVGAHELLAAACPKDITRRWWGLGGILGVACGIGLAEMMSHIMGTPVAISVPACIIAVAFSMVIGVVFGLVPAVKASKLNPIEALRRE